MVRLRSPGSRVSQDAPIQDQNVADAYFLCYPCNHA